MRLAFHRQLEQLYSTNSAVQAEISPPRWGEMIKAMTKTYKRGPFFCLPIVRQEIDLVCDLDILFLRRDKPGDLISGGDLDNRIKVLFDSLRVPQDDNEVRGFAPEDKDYPVIVCLTSDDRLITGFRVTTDTLLEPAASEAEKNNVQLIINVEIKATKLTEKNMAYLSHF